MDLIKIVDAKTGEPMGTMNWFSVHATSMKSTSGLISGGESELPMFGERQCCKTFRQGFWEGIQYYVIRS
jgi:hypothetical protein